MEKRKKTSKESVKKPQTIARRISVPVVKMMIIALAIIGLVSCVLIYFSAQSALKKTLAGSAKIASSCVEQEVRAYQNVAWELGCVARLSSTDLTDEEKLAIINQKVADYSLVGGDLIGTDGIGAIGGTNYSDLDFFKTAMQGNLVITEPIIGSDKSMSIIIAAPVWEGGVPNTTIVGVVILQAPNDLLSNIIAEISVSANSSSYIIDKSGNTIAHVNEDLVLTQSNTMEDAKTDSKLKKLAKYEKKMTQGESGFGLYTYGGKQKFLAYAPIEGENGWSFAVNAPVSDFLTFTYIGIILEIIMILFIITMASRILRRIANAVGSDAKKCTDRILLLAEGNLSAEIPHVDTEDEMGQLAAATSTIVKGLQAVISDLEYLLAGMADGNFNIQSQNSHVYFGDYLPLHESVQHIITSLSETLTQIHDASQQVSAAASQMAEGAQNLAEGATDQAGAVEEVFAMMGELTDQVKSNADAAIAANQKVKAIAVTAEESTEQIQAMTTAMEKISINSNEIKNITQTIEDIASQTNLLSLNASIEAARAGEAGKGFAVVANEIRTLAEQSAEAVVNTRELIEAALLEVDNGSATVDRTASAIRGVITGLDDVAGTVEKVTQASSDQSSSVAQVRDGLEQISNVVETNSATAEETSATSEELSAQAVSLDNLVGQFTLKE